MTETKTQCKALPFNETKKKKRKLFCRIYDVVYFVDSGKFNVFIFQKKES